MKVILASCDDTSNTQLSEVLHKLGFNVDGYMDHFWKHDKLWKKILTVGGCCDDFIEMYKDVDVVMEIPALFFWREVLDAFPNAKVIISPIDSNDMLDSWHQFTRSTKRGIFYRYVHFMTPVGWKFMAFRQNEYGLEFPQERHATSHELCFNLLRQRRNRFFNLELSFMKPYLPLQANKLILSRLIRQHYADIAQNAPKDQVLVYNSCDGWEPICKFLDVEIPKQNFPCQPRDDEIAEKSLYHPLVDRMRKEAIVSSVVVVSLSCASVYFLKRYWNKIQWSIIKYVVKVWYNSR